MTEIYNQTYHRWFARSSRRALLATLPTLLILLLVCSSALFPSVQAQPDEQCFTETGQCIRGRIHEFWKQHGGLAVFGLPITPQREEMIEGQPVQVQWFERNRLELHPHNEPPHDVLPGRLGVAALEQQRRDWQQFPSSEPQNGCYFAAETQHTVCGDILLAWQASGLELDGRAGTSIAESVALFGLPLSDAHTETITDTRGISTTLTVQWFERARFEVHPQNEPPFHVQLGLLGRQLQPASQPEAWLNPGGAPGNTDGALAFVSRHTGNAEVYRMQADGTITNLTNHPAEDVDPAWSPDGTQIAFASDRNGHFDIVVIRADGSEPRNLTSYWDTFVAAQPSDDLNPTWSPDGTRVAFESNRGGDGEIHVMDVQGFQQTNLTRHPGYDGDPAWSPDGTQIAFASNRDGAWNIFLMHPDGSEQRNITSSPDDAGAPAWSPDGTRLLFHALTFRPNRTANFEIYRMNADGTAQTTLTDNAVDDLNPAWSPDGTRVLFEASRDGVTSIYTIQAEGSPPVLLSNQPASSSEPDYSGATTPYQSPPQPVPGSAASPGQ